MAETAPFHAARVRNPFQKLDVDAKDRRLILQFMDQRRLPFRKIEAQLRSAEELSQNRKPQQHLFRLSFREPQQHPVRILIV